MTVDFHTPDSWYQPPADHDCPDTPEPCQCLERDEDGRDSALVDRDDADRGR